MIGLYILVAALAATILVPLIWFMVVILRDDKKRDKRKKERQTTPKKVDDPTEVPTPKETRDTINFLAEILFASDNQGTST
jgi:hypothetical protein